MKTLYVSDLDGTLLHSDEKTSAYTNQTINELINRGMLFTYATARSFQTAKKVTAGLRLKMPLIVYNGTMGVEPEDGNFFLKNFFGEESIGLVKELLAAGIYPTVYAFVEGEEKFSFLPEKCSRGMKEFLDSRKNDKRTRAVTCEEELLSGDIFYITCIDEKEKLLPFYEKYKEQYHCVFQIDLYSKEQWLEIMPKKASKANAIMQLKERFQCDRLVVFGDAKNDMDMFELAEEAYAVENAVPELKAIATGIVGANDEDGVAKWLRDHASKDEQI